MRKFSLIVLSFLLMSFLPSVHAAVGEINTFSGADRVTFSGDGGPSISAQLNGPRDVALDSDLNIYIVDTENHRIRKVEFTTGEISTFAGTGTAGFNGDGLAVNAQLNHPFRIAFDSNNNLFVADSLNHRIRRITPDGVMTTVAGIGIAGFSGDGGSAMLARLSAPLDVTVDTNGNLYIADFINSRIRKIDTDNIISTVAGSGTSGFSGDGDLATQARLNFPSSVAVDASANIYIADTNNHRIRKVDVTNGYIATIAGNGSPGFSGDDDIGQAINAQLNSPRGISIANNGSIIIADANNHRVRAITTENTIYTIAGTGISGYTGNGSPATDVQLSTPTGVFAFGATLYIADSENHRIRAFFSNTNTIATIAGAPRVTFNGDGGPAIDAQLYTPSSIGYDSQGNRYIADSNNHRIRKITPGGDISTIAGLEIDGNVAGFSGDNGPATSAQLNVPIGITIDSNNNLFFADSGNHRIRKITPGGVISTIAGLEIDGNAAGFSGDGSSATSAQLNFPTGIVIDSNNNLLFSDFGNHRIRKITPDGDISTIAGLEIDGNAAGFSGDDGPAISAQLNFPTGIAIDANDNLYIADRYNHRIRKIDSGGNISTIAGSGTAGFSGDGGIATAATLNYPTGVTFTAYGNLLISDKDNQRIRHLTSDNIITTIAGSGNIGFSGDGGQAINASLFFPFGIAVNNENTLYIADSNNNRVRTIELNTPPAGTDNTITALEDIARQFSTDDFGFNDVDDGHDTLASIKITSLPAVGTLKLNGVDVLADQVITRINIPRLRFTSALNGNGNSYDSFQFTVNDGFNNSKQNNTITMNVTAVNDAPIISGTPSLSVNEDSSYNFTPSAADIENDTITFSVSNKPDWLLFNTANGQLFGNPDNSQVGTYNNMIITASDGTASTSLPPFSITVVNTNDLPGGDISITGTREEGSILTVSTTQLSDDDGLGPFRYLWLRNGIHVSTNRSYLLGDADVGQTISVIISYTDRRGTDEIIPEKDAGSITGVNDAPTGSVTITGLPYIGVTLMAENTLSDADGLGSFSYEWRRSGTATPVGTSSSYPLSVADENQTLTVTISYTDGQGTMESMSSIPTSQITAAPIPEQDSDGDGMSDAFETTHGLNPAVDDAAGDLDGDGISNLQEFLDGTDPAPPEDFAPPANVSVNATGILTEVLLGSTTTNDGTDGVLTPQPDNNGPFLPGRHTITWTATDAAGNSTTASATQTIDVVPMVDFAIDQISEEGTTATVSVHLNGVAPVYPVNIPFNIDGNNSSFTPGTGAEGLLSISDSNVTDSITITTNASAFEGETITVNMGIPTGAVAGSKTSHTITITEQNLPPKVTLLMSQNSSPPTHTSTLLAGGGLVTVKATVSDPSATLDWSESDNTLIDSDEPFTNDTFTFNPGNLNIGTYTIAVKATDSIDSENFATLRHRFKVLVNVPDEGQNNYQDSDDDGIANYLDQIPVSYAVALQQEDQSQHIVETQPGLTLRLGAIAFESETNGVQVSETAIERYATSIRFPRDDHQNIGGLFNFEIHGLSQAGDSALVVIPLRKVIPAKPHYRKLMPTGWQDFIVDEKNSLASAPGENGICPPPTDSAYTTGLTSGHHCIQLRLEDGGPNDADGMANGVIIDPGGVAIEPIVIERPEPNVVTPLPDTGGGALNYLVLIFAWFLLFSHRRYKRS